jgi:hypothetical protein
MITCKRGGAYKLIETKKHTKVLYLDNDIYAWVEPINIGEILVVSHKVHTSDCTLSIGDYHIYDVTDEPELSDTLHLELEVGKGAWQGYLLLTGLPDTHKKRTRIIPTNETITNNVRYATRQDVQANLASDTSKR